MIFAVAKFYDALCTLQYSIKQILKITTTKIKNLQKFPKSPKFQKNIKIPIDFPVEPSGKIFFNENIRKTRLYAVGDPIGSNSASVTMQNYCV